MAVTATPAFALPCQADQVLKTALAAFAPGGVPLRTLHASSDLVIHDESGEIFHQQLIELYRFPKLARLEYRSARAVGVTATDGQKAWQISNQGPVPADPGHFTVPRRLRNLGALLLAARRYAAKSPPGKQRVTFECLSGAADGQQRILIGTREHEMVLLDVDVKTGLIYRYEGESPGTQGRADVIEVEIDDYQRSGGHWVARSLVTKVNGKTRATTKTTSVEVDVNVIEKLFERPDGIVGPPLKEL